MPIDSSGNSPATALHVAYTRLLERAAKTGWISPGGLTPREQCPLLAAHENIPESHRPGWIRLETLLDLCVYAGRGTVEEIREAMVLCAERSEVFAQPPPRPTGQPVARKVWPGFLHRVPASVIVLLVAVGSIALAPLVLRGIKGSGLLDSRASESASTASARGTWTREVHGEREAVSRFSKEWSTPPAKATVDRLAIDPVNRKEYRQARQAMDLTTGHDGYFPDAVDPFSPRLNWTHRLQVYTGISPAFECLAASPTRKSAFARQAKGPFVHRASVRVSLVAGKPVSVPCSTPDAMVSEYRTTGAVSLKFTRDDGDGLCVTGDVTSEIDLSYTLTGNTDYWNAPLPDSPLVPVEVALPANVRQDAALVLDRIGGIPGATYRDTVRRLQAYCSGFVVAPIEAADRRENDFLTLALSRKGVCRHRAWVFFVLGNASGIPTRLVSNRVHAFCEVQLPDSSWRRIEFRLESLDAGPGNYPMGQGIDFNRAPFSALGQVAMAAALLVALLLVAALGGRNDRELHHLARTAGSPLDARAARDSRLAIGPGIQALALAVSLEAVEFEKDMPPPVKERQRHLEQFAAAPSPDLDAGELKRVHWDCLQILGWLRKNRGDERT
ncbi:MAG: transglutaminase-like domain-containing protein [Planctomycetes bacterium]|nr:transglutaminase-like domain-containing protein [Planctomycetota bacterium]